MAGLQIDIDPSLPLFPELHYTLTQFAVNKKIKLSFNSNGLRVSDSEQAPIQVSKKFAADFTARKFNHLENLRHSGFIELENGQRDYLSTAFYMLACLQEYDTSQPPDRLGRFKFENSYQHTLKLATENRVQFCFDKLAEKIGIPSADTPSRFFLSHDIDLVYGSLLQDGFYAFKRGRLDIIFRLLMNVGMSRPDWLNIDKIMALESEYDLRSTFFWIVNKGKAGELENADYDFSSGKIQRLIKKVEETGFENGLHKSISSDTFQQELDRFEKRPVSNRYHYLKFSLPQGFDVIEQAGLKLDASLGFAETIGFRNSYGQPYNPFNVKERRAYSFVEVPLHVMDRTFFQYEKMSPKEAKKQVIDFFERNNQNCVLSVLWHNNFFTNYKFKGYLDLYKSILLYIRENNFTTITQEELLTNYLIH